MFSVFRLGSSMVLPTDIFSLHSGAWYQILICVFRSPWDGGPKDYEISIDCKCFSLLMLCLLSPSLLFWILMANDWGSVSWEQNKP